MFLITSLMHLGFLVWQTSSTSGFSNSNRQLEVGESIAIWIVFNVLLAVMPLGLSPLFRLFSNSKLGSGWKLLRDGELFFFSSTLSAASIGKSFELFWRQESSVNVYTFLGLLLILMSSAICFGVTNILKIKREDDSASAGIMKGDKIISKGSILVALLAVFFSLAAFYQGAFK